MADSRRLAGPFLLVFADLTRPPLTLMLPMVDRLNRIHDYLDTRKLHVTGHVVPGEEHYLWQEESDDPDQAARPINPWVLDRTHGAVFFCAANFKPLTPRMVRWIKDNLLIPVP